jgi:hypothetical protein
MVCGIPPQEHSGQDQRGKGERFCRREYILDQLPEFQSAGVEQRQKKN